MTDDVAGLVRATVDKIRREYPGAKLQPATVIQFTRIDGEATATVKFDGDGNDNPIQVTSILVADCVPGDRVMVLFDPPQGAYIIGVLSFSQPELAGGCCCHANAYGQLDPSADYLNGFVWMNTSLLSTDSDPVQTLTRVTVAADGDIDTLRIFDGLSYATVLDDTFVSTSPGNMSTLTYDIDPAYTKNMLTLGVQPYWYIQAFPGLYPARPTYIIIDMYGDGLCHSWELVNVYGG